MKKGIILFMLATVLLVLGFWVERFYEIAQDKNWGKKIEQGEQELSERINDYPLTCSELTNKDLPILHKIGKDYIVVIPRNDDYIVFGINAEGEKQPVTTWYGADIKNEIDQVCHKDHSQKSSKQ